MNHKIILLIGPSCVGKSTLSKLIAQQASDENLKCAIISSDSIRRQLLCDFEMDKMSGEMLESSQQAFSILENLVDAHTSYPVNTNIVVVDTTGLDPAFRQKMISIARKNHYQIEAIVLDFGRIDLEKFVGLGGGNLFVTQRHSKKLREEVLPNINRKDFSFFKVFKKPEEIYGEVPFDFIRSENHEAQVYVNEEDRVVVIGDVHECVDEFNALIEKIPADVKVIVLLGDLFDKGKNTQAMFDRLMKFYGECVDNGIQLFVIRGNHERYVYKRLMRMIPENVRLEEEFFDSLKFFRNDETAALTFRAIYENSMVNSLKIIRGNERSIVATHAPCSNKYIGKSDNVSSGKQINFYFENRDPEKMLDELKFISEEAVQNHPWHVFGHVAHSGSKPFMIKNKIFMDTGCVHGGYLSAAIFRSRFVDFVSVKSSKENKGDLLVLEKPESKVERILKSEVRLSDEDQRIVNRVIRGGARFISGTMCPAPSTSENIESLQDGLNVFKTAGVTEVVIQPKYMGSRAQAYIYKDSSKNFAISRNGFKINIPGIEEAILKLQADVEAIGKVSWNEELILDCELLPWYALGKGLIEGEFIPYLKAIDHHFNQLKSDDVFNGFDIAKSINVDQKIARIPLFENQINLYGKQSEIYFKAFSILSIDGIPSNEASSFGLVNTDEYIESVSVDDFDRINEFYQKLTTEKGFEGIVIKPLVYNPNQKCPPYMKVRNPEYLRLVYGFDYDLRLQALCAQKSIGGKMRLSIDEYALGMAMLAESDKGKRDHLIAAMFGQIAKERDLDPRL